MLPNPFVNLYVLQLKHVLDNIVTIGVFDECPRVPRYLVSEFHFLGGIGPINALLHNAAAVLVTRDLHALFNHCIVNELVALWTPGEQNLLDHMISIYVLGKFPHAVL